MKISGDQVRAALDAYKRTRRDGRAAAGDGAQPSADAAAVDAFGRRLHDLPDERTGLVDDLRTKVQGGSYHVPGKEIAGALLGRLAADLLDEA